jgi:hypothetical protein
MDDATLTILVLVLGVAIGWRLHAAFSRFTMLSIMRDMGITEQQLKAQMKKYELETEPTPEDELTVIEVTLEQHQGQLYAFRKDDDSFLGQGRDRDSLIDDLKSKMNNVRLVIVEGNELIKATSNE